MKKKKQNEQTWNTYALFDERGRFICDIHGDKKRAAEQCKQVIEYKHGDEFDGGPKLYVKEIEGDIYVATKFANQFKVLATLVLQ